MRILFATCSPEKAETILEDLLRERLVACGNLIRGVRSLYWWEGEICRDEEVVMLMETRDELVATAMSRLKEIHPYDVPKIISIDPERCDAEYASWIQSVTRDPRGPE